MTEIKTLSLSSDNCKQEVKINLSPNVENYQNRLGRTFISVNPYTCNLEFRLSVSGKENSANKHSVKMTLKKYDANQKLSKDASYTITGNAPLIIPIDSYSSYVMSFQTNEWGETCKKPTGVKNWTVINQKEKILEPPNDDEFVEPVVNPILYPLAMLAGAGVILGIYSFMNND